MTMNIANYDQINCSINIEIIKIKFVHVWTRSYISVNKSKNSATASDDGELEKDADQVEFQMKLVQAEEALENFEKDNCNSVI